MNNFDALACEHLKLDGPVSDSLTPKDVPHWDSMNYLLFISQLEKAYNVSFSMDEVLNAQSLGDVRKALRSKGISI